MSDHHATSKIQKLTLSNQHNMQVTIADFGARILSIKVPTPSGDLIETTLNYTLDDDILRDVSYLGATCGRVANRIGGAQYFADKELISLNKNDGNNILHGGTAGFSHRFWQMEGIQEHADQQSVVLTLESKDGDQGFPGELHVQVRYTLDNNNRLSIQYTAQCSKPCPINLCNHTYFHLGEDSIHNLLLRVSADHYLASNEHSVPTGEILSAIHDFDLSALSPVGSYLNKRDFDDCYVLNKSAVHQHQPACKLVSKQSNIALEIFSDHIGLQVYTGNYLAQKYRAIALEAQGLVDAVNHPGFASDWVGPGQDYAKNVHYQFKLM